MKKNNLIFAFGIVIIACGISLFLQWGTFIAQQGMYGGIPVTTTGLNGAFTLMGIKIPHWLLSTILALSALIAILNIKKVIKTPTIIAILLDIFVLLWLGLGLYFYIFVGTLGIGLIIIAIAAVSSLLLKIFNKNLL